MNNKLLLLNDVHSEWDDYGFLIGGSDIPADTLGKEQSIEIAQKITSMFSVNRILTSDAMNLLKLLHYLQTNSKKSLEGAVVYTDTLRERNFGVLSGTTHPLTSEIFTHSRICSESGESVSQCKDRAMTAIKKFCDKYPVGINLIVSHPFVCQIVSNVLLSVSLTEVGDFWFQKGSFILFDNQLWNMEKQGNVLEN
ncbi:hypothetical protein LCGC14_0997240 [marine sediment metagenome]|uniref:Histidine phosphatase family protein n=1 Tax=marine sediment metagenome TaxID=412755 RepID=A0A0F9NQM6_9ZZZZ